MNGEDELTSPRSGASRSFGRHGVYPPERELGQRFVVDIDIQLSDARSAQTDDLTHTADYGPLAAAVAEIVGGAPVALLERLASLIADRVLAEPRAPLRRGDGPQAPRRAAAGRQRDLRHPPPARGARYWLGLGGNLGDPRRASPRPSAGSTSGTRSRPSAAPTTRRPASLPDQPSFLNAAPRVRAALDPPGHARRGEGPSSRSSGGPPAASGSDPG